MTDSASAAPSPDENEATTEHFDAKTLHDEIAAASAENRRNARRVFDALKEFGSVLDALGDSLATLQRQPVSSSSEGTDRALLAGLVELFDRIERISRAAARRPAGQSSWWPPAARALAAYEADRRQLEDAFSILHEHAQDLMQGAGLQRIVARDQAFDPHTMTAVEASQRSDLPDRTVLEEIGAGWRLSSGEILRPARVRVSRSVSETPN